MMAVTRHLALATIMTFLQYGVLPLTIILCTSGSHGGRRRSPLGPGSASIGAVVSFAAQRLMRAATTPLSHRRRSQASQMNEPMRPVTPSRR